MENDFALRFPIGESKPPELFDASRVRREVAAIATLPADLSALIRSADRRRLANTYRPGGWTALQVVHHVADSHINSYCRFKLALTEDNPTIKPYDEAAWALLPDYDQALVDSALDLLRALHAKWAHLLERLTEEQWRRTFYHPESKRQTALYQAVAIYAWHGAHHLRHVEMALGK
jgi:hypothetical protein